MKAAGLPHSETCGSKPVDGSPQLVAVFRVLHSLLMPRHPSCARIRLARLGIGVRFLRSLRPDRMARTRSLRKLKASTYLFCLMRNFSLYGGDRSPPISYMSCNSLSTSNCLLSKIEPAFARRASARQTTSKRGRSRKQQTLVHALRSPDGRRRVSPSLPEGRCLLRKEVIQPLVPQRLPCYDFIPITTHTLGRQMPDFGCRRLS